MDPTPPSVTLAPRSNLRDSHPNRPMRHPLCLPALAATLLLGAFGCTDHLEPEPWEFRESVDAGDTAVGPPETGPDADAGPVVKETCHDEVTVAITADDFWRGWLDGEQFGADDQWRAPDTIEVELSDDRRHVVAVAAEDRRRVISGLIAEVRADDRVLASLSTGSGAWRVRTSPPASEWRTAGFDASGWEVPTPVSSDCTSTWSGSADFEHAEWVWQSDCTANAAGWHLRNWYRLAFETADCDPGR